MPASRARAVSTAPTPAVRGWWLGLLGVAIVALMRPMTRRAVGGGGLGLRTRVA